MSSTLRDLSIERMHRTVSSGRGIICMAGGGMPASHARMRHADPTHRLTQPARALRPAAAAERARLSAWVSHSRPS